MRYIDVVYFYPTENNEECYECYDIENNEFVRFTSEHWGEVKFTKSKLDAHTYNERFKHYYETYKMSFKKNKKPAKKRKRRKK